MSAVYIKNRLPSLKTVTKTPFEIVYKPSVKHMRVFYVLTPKKKRLKWDAKSCAGAFMGYKDLSKAYRVYDIEAEQVFFTRNVNFNETKMGLTALNKIDSMDDVLNDLDDLDMGEDKGTASKPASARPALSRLRPNRPTDQEPGQR